VLVAVVVSSVEVAVVSSSSGLPWVGAPPSSEDDEVPSCVSVVVDSAVLVPAVSVEVAVSCDYEPSSESVAAVLVAAVSAC